MEDSRYTTGEYVDSNPTYHVEDSPWKVEQIRKMMARHNLAPKTICEIGCGAGEILRLLQKELNPATKLHGYEISPQGFSMCKERQNPTLQFYCEDLLALKVEPYDLLLCIDVFEHVDDYLGFLRKLKSKGNHTIFHIPLDLSVQTLLRSHKIPQGRAQLGHLHYFTKDTALLTLKDAGFEIVDWFYTAESLDRATSFKSRLAKIPRKMLNALNHDLSVRVLGGHSLLVLAR